MATAKESIRSMLAGGDRRSIGRAGEVVALIQRRWARMPRLMECLWDADPCVCMRAADAVEKITRGGADILQSYKPALLGLLAETKQPEVRWHLAVVIPRLSLTAAECRRAAAILQSYLTDRSSIVKTSAMQGLSDLARRHASLQPAVLDLLRSLARTGTAAMRARGRNLLKEWTVES